MKKLTKTFSFILVAGIYLVLPNTAHAVCPVCTVAVGAGLGLSRYFGIDDMVSGIWVGGLMISLTLWTVDWLSKKNWKFLKYLNKINKNAALGLSFLFWILLTYPPLSWAGIIGHPFNTVFGIDKLFFGSILGTVMFILGVLADKKVRKIKGRQLFSYQKVVFPVIALLIASLVLFFYGGYLK